jgi:hypothetical protein
MVSECEINIGEANRDSIVLKREEISNPYLPEDSAGLHNVLIYVQRASKDKQFS